MQSPWPCRSHTWLAVQYVGLCLRTVTRPGPKLVENCRDRNVKNNTAMDVQCQASLPRDFVVELFAGKLRHDMLSPLTGFDPARLCRSFMNPPIKTRSRQSASKEIAIKQALFKVLDRVLILLVIISSGNGRTRSVLVSWSSSKPWSPVSVRKWNLELFFSVSFLFLELVVGIFYNVC